MCVREGNLIRACEPCLRAEIATAFERFPELARIVPSGDDWADAQDVADIYVRKIHDAWDRVREARYLLGDDA